MSKIENGADGTIRLSQEYPVRENPQLTDAIIVGDVASGTVSNTTAGNIKTLYTGSIAENNEGFVTGGDVAGALASKSDSDAVNAALDTKVDKVEGMGLSHEDYTAPEKDDVATLSMFYKPVNDALDGINGEPVRGGVPGKLSKLENSKEEIRLAIVSKGVEVTELESMAGYAGKIAEILSDKDSLISLFNQRYTLTDIGSEYDAIFSALTDGSYMFRDCSGLTSFSADLSALTNAEQMFCSCTGLTSFSSDLSALTNGRDMFGDCPKLTDITLTGSLNADGINLSGSSLLTVESLLSVLNALTDRTGQTTGSLILVYPLLAKLTAEQIAIATNKNWELSDFI